MCLPIVLKIFGPCRGSQPGFVVVWKPSFSRGENVLSYLLVDHGYSTSQPTNELGTEKKKPGNHRFHSLNVEVSKLGKCILANLV